MRLRNNKSLLVLAASVYQLDVIKTAKRLGYRVITTDNVPSNPGHRLAHTNYQIDTTDRHAVLEMARSEEIDGVIAACTDVAMPTAAHIASVLGLPGPQPQSVETVTDKLLFRRFLAEHGFLVPRWFAVGDSIVPEAVLFTGKRWVIKPNRSSGSKGIFVIDSIADYQQRIPETLQFIPTRSAIIEEYIDGHQGTCEGVLKGGEMALAVITDRQTPELPYVTTCGHRVPSNLSVPLQDKVLATLCRLWSILAITDGPFDSDFVVTHDEVYILEGSPRLGGNSMTALVRAATGFDMIEYAIQHACADDAPISNMPRIIPSAVVIIGVFAEGRLYYDQREAEIMQGESWIERLNMDVRVGEPVYPFINGRHRIGEAVIRGRDRAEIDARVDELTRRLALRVVH